MHDSLNPTAKVRLLIEEISKDPDFAQLPSEFRNKILETGEELSGENDEIGLSDIVLLIQLILSILDLVRSSAAH